MTVNSIAIYWRESESLTELANQGFYSAGWFSAFEDLGLEVVRKGDAEFFDGFAPNLADWHLYLPGTPQFHEGGDFRTFQPPKEGKRALLLEEDIHYKLHQLILFCQTYDLVVVHDWLTYQALRMSGCRTAFWVPPAFDPLIFRPLDLDKELDVAFLGDVGRYYHKKGFVRQDYLREIDARFSNEKKIIGRGFYGPAANEWYNKAKIVFDFPTYENVGPRVVQVLGCGRLLLLNRLTNTDVSKTHGLVDGVHYASFDGTMGDLNRRIDWFLDHSEAREKVAAMGHEQSARFTYISAATEILSSMMEG